MTASPSTPKAWVARRMRVASSTSTAVGLRGSKRRRAASSGAAAGIGAGGRAERAGAWSGCGGVDAGQSRPVTVAFATWQ